jgi:hypothetical protein
MGLYKKLVRARLYRLDKSGKEISDEDRANATVIKWKDHKIPRKLQTALKRDEPLSEQEVRSYTGALSWLIKSEQVFDEGGAHGNHSIVVLLH